MKENLLRLIIVDDSSNDAEAIINLMRRAGYGVRATRAHNHDNLQAALKEQMPDIVLCNSTLADFTVQQALVLIKKTGKDISFIVFSESSAGPSTVEFFNAGARDVVPKSQSELVQLVVTREYKDLEGRREYRRCLKAFRETEKRCRSLIDSSRDAIAYVHDGMHIYANSVYLRMFGYQTTEELEGTPIMDLVAPSDHARFKDFLRTYAMDEESTKELEVNGLHTDSRTFSARMKFSPASIDGEACTEIIIQDLSQDQEFEKKIKTLSQQDLLTGLYNRRYFFEQIESAVAKAASQSDNSILLYIQLDNFQTIKGNVGIAASDLVLRDIATQLRSQVDESSSLAYFDEDVFCMLLQDAEIEQAQQLAENIRKTLEEKTFDAAGQPITMTCRIVIGLIAEYILHSKQLLSDIYKASAELKIAGGNKIYLYSPDAEARSAKGKIQEQKGHIQKALDTNLFRLLYQPIVSLHGLPGENYQITVCMLDAGGNEIKPDKFLPAAEHVGLNNSIDRWIITHAIEVLVTKRRAGTKLTFFIKLFEQTLVDESLLPWISNMIKAARLEADSLVFTLSETTVASHLPEAQAFIKGLKELRCGFCLDHFGANANSLKSLKHMPAGINYLKIDASFQATLSTNAQNQAAVKAINEAAHALKITTIAENVEDAGTLAVLWQCGVNYVQGFYLQKPSATLNYDFSGNAE